MKIRYKLFLSLLFLFGIITLLGSIGIYYLKWLADDSKAILQDNNRTLNYMQGIEDHVDAIEYLYQNDSNDSLKVEAHFTGIDSLMQLQLRNITEPGEKELSIALSQDIESLVRYHTQNKPLALLVPVIHDIKQKVDHIYLINQKTMVEKNHRAGDTARKVILYMGLFGSLGIAVGLIFIFWLPGYISGPLETFNEGIKEVARGNYNISVPFDTHDEFGELGMSFNQMASKLNEYEHSNIAKLIKEQRRLNAVINQMDDVILGLDENKRIIFANDHCIKLLNIPKGNLLGKYAPDLATNNALLNNLIKELMLGFLPGEDVSYKPLKIVEDNKEKLFSKNVVDVVDRPTGESKNHLFGHVIILTDITQFAERDKAKTQFMATLSHELKTPVAAIQMSAGLLKNEKPGTLNPEQRELLETIESNNERIRRMINEILDISKIESGIIDITLQNEKVSDLVDRAIDGVKPFLNRKSLDVTKQMEFILPNIRVDAHKTVWILNNFLTNAIRYSPEGSEIIVQAKKEKQCVKISVKDNGPGIIKKNQSRIFQKFTKLSSTSTGGTGLGLAISKEFMEAMGGTIGVESDEGEGATFWIKCNLSKDSDY